jgi:hypothetical protein
MSQIRPLQAGDVPAVAGLFQRIFRHSDAPPPAGLLTYLQRHYLEAPGFDPEIRPLVHATDEGTITGFVGVNALPMRLGDRHLRAAVCGSLMVEHRGSDPMAGARLLKAFLAGPQDLSFSETASELSAQMWTSLRGIVLPQYSLDWVRIIRPSAFMLDLAGDRLGALRLLSPLAKIIDGRLRKPRSGRVLRWALVPEDWLVKGGLCTADSDAAAFAEAVATLTSQFALRPAWSEACLAHVIAEASDKPEWGQPVFGEVRTPSGALVGAFMYHLAPGRIARVMQVLARPGQAGPVIDCLTAHAAAHGAAGLRGRTQPALLKAMLGRRIAFTHVASTVVHARDAALLRELEGADAFLNGLSGEHWSRLVGGRFT